MNELDYNIVTRLIHQHVNSTNKKALSDFSLSYDYSNLQKFIYKFHSYLKSYSLSSSNIIALVLGDSVFAWGCFLGIINSGYIAAPINPDLPIFTYQDLFKKLKPNLVLVEKINHAKLASVCSELGINCYDIDLNRIQAYPEVEYQSLGEKSRPAFALFTSGTTGTPKCVFHRHKDMEVIAENYGQNILKIQSTDVIYTTSRLFFGYGLNSILLALYNGCSAYLPDPKLNLENVFHRLTKADVSIFFSVPTIFGMLLDKKETPNKITPRMCLSAGEPLPETIQKRWIEKFNLPIFDGIGSTEILSMYISSSPQQFKINATGKIVPGFEAKILAENNEPVKQGECGVLYVKGDTYTASYYNDPEISKDRYLNDWFKTNDLFTYDQDGFFFYHGRYDHLIKCGGVWIYPNKIENMLLTHPAVTDCVVMGKKDLNNFIRPTAYIILNKKEIKSSISDLINELKVYCKNKISRLEYPHFIEFVEKLHFTPSGKKKRFLVEN